MGKSREVTVTITSVGTKVAEIDIYFIRLPGVSDDYIKNGLIQICNGVFSIAEPNLEAKSVTLKQVNWMFWCGTVDVYQKEQSTPWAFIAGAIIGAVLAGIIIYWVVVRPLKETMVSVSKKISDVEAEIDQAVTEGKIDQETANKLKSMLESARTEAEKAGEDWLYDWVKYLKPVIEILPLVVVLAIISAIVGIIPRRGD